MKFILPMIAAAAVAVAATPATAATFFATTLSSANEVPTNASTATGSGTLLLATGNNSINVFLSWAGISAPATGAHIHCCALPGSNASVAIDFGPPALTTGSLSRTYDLTLLSTYTTGFVNANGGTVATAQAAFVAGLLSGRTYYNVHNSVFPGGEIRGQLAVAVPEAATWGMMIIGMGIVGGNLRMRRRAAVAV